MTIDRIRIVPEIGRVNRMETLPVGDMISACRKLLSLHLKIFPPPLKLPQLPILFPSDIDTNPVNFEPFPSGRLSFIPGIAKLNEPPAVPGDSSGEFIFGSECCLIQVDDILKFRGPGIDRDIAARHGLLRHLL